MHVIPRGLVVPAVVLGIVLAGCAKAPPRGALDANRVAVDDLLAHAETEGQIAAFVGAPPERCVASSGTLRLCQWRLGNRQPGWEPLARALGTGDQVNLLCELPDAGPRASDACVAFPRRSDRGLYALPNTGGGKHQRAASTTRQQVQARHESNARAQLEGARTLVALSHLVGAVPDGCSRVDAATRLCFWRASNQTYGHGTLVLSSGISKRKRVVLRCSLPRDGSPRGLESCHVEEGS